MTIARAVTATFPHPRPFQALRLRAGATLAPARPTRHTRRRPTLTPSLAPPLIVWQVDRHELSSALEHSRW